jgi:hypothetical protein
MPLADLDRWDPNAIQPVFSAATDNSAATRMTSDQLGRITDAIPWEGEAYDAARTANTNVRRNLIRASATALVDAEEKHSTALSNVVSELPNSAT